MPMHSVNHKECPNCGARLQPASVPNQWVCPYCGETFMDDSPPQAPAAAAKEVRKHPSQTLKALLEKHRPALSKTLSTLLDDSLIRSTTRHPDACKKWHAPASEACYLLFDGTFMWGSCRWGFMVCDTGIYYTANRGNAEKHYLSWNDFRKSNLRTSEGNLFIDDFGFHTGNETTQLYNFLKDIKAQI